MTGDHTTGGAERLVLMANQIGTFFASQGKGGDPAGVAGHIRAFWDPRMRARLLAHLDEGGAGLAPIVVEALRSLRNKKG